MPRTISIPTKQDTAKITVAAALASLALLANHCGHLAAHSDHPGLRPVLDHPGQQHRASQPQRRNTAGQGHPRLRPGLHHRKQLRRLPAGISDHRGQRSGPTPTPSATQSRLRSTRLETTASPAPRCARSGTRTPSRAPACTRSRRPPPAAPVLPSSPKRTYFITVTLPYSDSTDTIHLSHNDVDNEDAGAADGWHIHDRSYSAHSAWTTHDEELQIQVSGEANAAPQGSIATNADTDENTGEYLVTGGDTITLDGATSDADGDTINHFWVSGVGGNFSHGWSQDTDWTAPPSRDDDYDAILYLVATDEHGARTILTIQVTVTTGERPDPPTALQSAVSDVNHVSLSWTNNHDDDDIDSMALQQRVLGQWHTIRNLDNDATSVDLGQASPSETLEFRLTIATSSGYRGYSDTISVKTLEGAPAPRHFAASTVTQTSVTLTWHTLETAAEYRLQYRKSGDAEWTRGERKLRPPAQLHQPPTGLRNRRRPRMQHRLRLPRQR